MRTFEELFVRFQKQKTSEMSDARTRRKRFGNAIWPNSQPLDDGPSHSSLSRARLTNLTLSQDEASGLVKQVFPEPPESAPDSATPAQATVSTSLSEPAVIALIQEVFPGAYVQHYRVVPSDCVYRNCPAAGYWEGHGNEASCFYEAVFLGRAAKPQLARDRQRDCPRKDDDG